MIDNILEVQKITAENSMLSDIVEHFLIFENHKIEESINYQFSRNELLHFKEQLEIFLGDNETLDKSNLTEKREGSFKKRYKSGPLCSKCGYRKKTNCQICMFDLQSSLEQKLFFELYNKKIEFHHHYWLDHNGNHSEEISKSNSTDSIDILTIADFYIEGQGFKLCIYTEGYNSNIKNTKGIREYRNIDKKLNELGIKTMRYLSNDYNEDLKKIVLEIDNLIGCSA